MFTIFRLTIKEVIRKRIFLVILLLTFAFLILYGIANHFAMKDIGRYGYSLQKLLFIPQLFSIGLYFSSFIVALLTIFSGVASISGEIDSGVLHAIIPKPIKRSEILLGKYFGYATIISLYSSIFFLLIAAMVSFQTNYAMGNIIPAMLLYALGPLILLALSMWGSTFMSTLANGVAIFMLYILGSVGGMVETIGLGIKSLALQNVGIITSLIMPSDAIYKRMISSVLTASNVIISVPTPFGGTSAPSNAMVVYAVIYLIVMLTFAVVNFNKKDI